MVKSKTILDIRYFESHDTIHDGFNPQNIGKLLKSPTGSDYTGARIARKLRELDFKTGSDFDHLYIHFTDAVPAGKIRFSERTVDREDAWLRYVDVGVCFSKINRLTPQAKNRWLESITLDVARFIANRDPDQLSKIETVSEEIQAWGEDLPILHFNKETKSYTICISYRISNKPNQSSIWIDYIDHKTGVVRSGRIAKLRFYEDVFFLVSSVSVIGDKIHCKPRSSYKAKLYNQRYKVPFCIDISKLPIVDEPPSSKRVNRRNLK